MILSFSSCLEQQHSFRFCAETDLSLQSENRGADVNRFLSTAVCSTHSEVCVCETDGRLMKALLRLTFQSITVLAFQLNRQMSRLLCLLVLENRLFRGTFSLSNHTYTQYSDQEVTLDQDRQSKNSV